MIGELASQPFVFLGQYHPTTVSAGGQSGRHSTDTATDDGYFTFHSPRFVERTSIPGATGVDPAAPELAAMIVFVCTGNTCRSPMAQAVAEQRWPLYSFESAGLAATSGRPASTEAIRVAEERGLPLTSHRSRPLTRELIEKADRVYTMTAGHRDALLDLFPEHESKIQTLLASQDVADPYGGSRDVYADCLDQLEQAIAELEIEQQPLALFEEWLGQAFEAGVSEANAMCLATANAGGVPSARYVLLRGCDSEGFRFFTNYESRKARELKENPRASVVFWWSVLKRQIRIEGEIHSLSAEASDEYFQSRPRGSQLGAWASIQSRPLESRAELLRRVEAVEDRFPAKVERPEFWGGYLLVPQRYEFWMGRNDRLHDRFVFELEQGRWNLQRLYP